MSGVEGAFREFQGWDMVVAAALRAMVMPAAVVGFVLWRVTGRFVRDVLVCLLHVADS